MARVFLLILDSFGVGGAADADKFGDVGSDTFLHIAQSCALGKANKEGMRAGGLHLPNLAALGLGLAGQASSGTLAPNFSATPKIIGKWGFAIEQSNGKDTPTGHWEIGGFKVDIDWGYFPQTIPCFPDDLIAEFCKRAKLPGVLANQHASGIPVIKQFGEESLKTGKPIVYTSVDSVFQIAAHEEHFGLDRLYEVCQIAFELTAPLNIGRVIARPFIGNDANDFSRTGNRHDYAIKPTHDTILDRAKNAGRQVIAVGKISDIYAGRGVTTSLRAHLNDNIFNATLEAEKLAKDGDFVMSNFVDFDMLFGHPRDVPGYANALEEFDKRLPELYQKLQDDDIIILTADHGNDPTWEGSNHTREHVPVLVYGKNLTPGTIGARQSFCDIAETVAEALNLPHTGGIGVSFLC
ncbi:MAG: phosphopentomutase [Rhizobiales bacterium]|nr:phosphopentomutase [Hyphomicrobiales bacterium]NRB15352.1 phosphopentomutase [Hyphomicrobiales bacterium]